VDHAGRPQSLEAKGDLGADADDSGALTVQDVLEMRREMPHCDAVEAWARSVWDAWELHHSTVRDWVEGALEKVGQNNLRTPDGLPKAPQQGI